MKLNGDDEVSYLAGSREGKPKFLSWKRFWLLHIRNMWPLWCQIAGCYNQATFGAQVKIWAYPGEFILPSCRNCYLLEGLLTPKIAAEVAWAKVRRYPV